jgi:hypothetical protein
VSSIGSVDIFEDLPVPNAPRYTFGGSQFA